MTKQNINGIEQLKIKADIEANNKIARGKLNLPYAERLINDLKGGLKT